MKKKCPRCNGSGYLRRKNLKDSGTKNHLCLLCNGTGLVPKIPVYIWLAGLALATLLISLYISMFG